MEGGTATSPSKAVVSGVVTGIRLLAVMVLQRILRAVKMHGHKIRFCPQHWLLCHLGVYQFEFEFGIEFA
jgi:hypothetical protein